MKRLFTSESIPGQGAVYRDLSECPACACLDSFVVPVISGPGCSEFPTKDNDYASLPNAFPPDVEIATVPFDGRLSALDTAVFDVQYPDMWTLISPQPDLQETVLEADCYCPGDGIFTPGLTTGRPAFPLVSPLPFFWFPAIDIPAPITVRDINPDSTIPGDCCPTGLADFIRAEIVGNELQLTHVRKADLEERYRTRDMHVTFQARAGYPKWCCVDNECNTGSTDLEPDHTLKWLHFLRWPSEDRNPYDEVLPEEPLGIIPIIPDIQCDPTTGILHVYHANIIVHDGIIAGLQWDTPEPREYPGLGDPTVAPLNPILLEVNKDYQGNEIYPEIEFAASSTALLGEPCTENCDQAMGNLLRAEDTCQPLCPQDGVLCNEDRPVGYVGSGTGASPSDATSAAVADLQAMIPPECDPIQLIWICYTVYDDIALEYQSEAKGCCPS